jgi:hypothetical protein
MSSKSEKQKQAIEAINKNMQQKQVAKMNNQSEQHKQTIVTSIKMNSKSE